MAKKTRANKLQCEKCAHLPQWMTDSILSTEHALQRICLGDRHVLRCTNLSNFYGFSIFDLTSRYRTSMMRKSWPKFPEVVFCWEII